MQDERAGADREHRFACRTACSYKIDELGVRDFGPCSLATRYKQVVKRRTVLERHVRIDRQAFGASDGHRLLRNHEALWSACHLLPNRDHLPWANEVEFLDLGKNEYSEGHGEPQELFWDT